MNLETYSARDFERGASKLIEACWILCAFVFSSSLPGSHWRCSLLRIFGAKIGRGVVIKPSVRIKFPWRLSIGDFTWIGESVWIDNLVLVSIGRDCCVSQGSYFCTGNHRWDKSSFDLACSSITLENEIWIGAFTVLGPGTYVEEGAVIAIGSVVNGRIAGRMVSSGNPCVAVKQRK